MADPDSKVRGVGVGVRGAGESENYVFLQDKTGTRPLPSLDPPL